MNLNKDLVVVDLESTGVNTAEDRIVQICIMKINKDGKINKTSTTLINPEMPIPQGASDVHHITDEMVKNAPTFKEKASQILKYIHGCDFLGFNSNRFDVVMLYNEFLRCGLEWDYKSTNFLDAHTIYVRKEERTLEAAVRYYLNREHTGSHDAEIDVIATWEVFRAQLNKYEDVPKSFEELNLYCNFDKPRLDLGGKLTLNENGEIVFNFGKNKDIRIKDDINYAQWMLKADFAPDTKDIIRKTIYEK